MHRNYRLRQLQTHDTTICLHTSSIIQQQSQNKWVGREIDGQRIGKKSKSNRVQQVSTTAYLAIMSLCAKCSVSEETYIHTQAIRAFLLVALNINAKCKQAFRNLKFRTSGKKLTSKASFHTFSFVFSRWFSVTPGYGWGPVRLYTIIMIPACNSDCVVIS